MTKIIQSFIFAAGRGQRMKPLTDNRPKPLALIKDKAILDYIVEKIDKIDSITKIVINGYYLSDQIQSHIVKLNNPKIEFSKETEGLETGGGLVFAAKNSKIDINQPILLVNGDILWQDDGGMNKIENIDNFYQQNDCDIALGMVKSESLIGYRGSGDFDIDKNGDLSKNQQKNSHVFTGLAIINPKILKLAPSKAFSMGYFYNNFQDLGLKMKGIELKSQFFHISDMESLKSIQEIFLLPQSID